jgi:voltage-gated potassium channel
VIGRGARSSDLRERVLVHYNFLRVVLPQFKVSIGVFLAANVLGAFVLYTDPSLHTEGGEPLTFLHAVYTALGLNFFEVAAEYPHDGRLLTQATYFLLPAVGLLVIAEGLVRLGVVILSRKRMSEEWHMALAETFNDHVILAGLGKIGTRVASRLQKDERLVCLELQKEKAEHLELSENVAVLIGDATAKTLLAKANVKNARAIMALTDNDLANLEIALSAREANPKIRVVLRMFNEDLGRQLVKQFNFEAVFSTSSLAAPSFSSALYSNRILQTIEIGDEKRVHLARVVVSARSEVIGKTILQLEQEAQVSVVLHHTRGDQKLLPSVEAAVVEGDELFVLAELPAIDECDRLASGAGDAAVGETA